MIFLLTIFRASLVPVFSFGENELYDQVSNPPGSALRQWQTKVKELMGFAPPLFCGRGVFQYTFGLLPHRRPIYTVGKLNLLYLLFGLLHVTVNSYVILQ